MHRWFCQFLPLKRAPGPPGSLAALSGSRGEAAAARFLKKKGYRILARNWRGGPDARDELDLVALDGEALVFIEVRARDEAALVPGFASLTARKKNALRRACQAYLQGLARRPHTWRVDVVAVTLRAGRPLTIDHFTGIDLK